METRLRRAGGGWLLAALCLAGIGLSIAFFDRPFAAFSHAILRRPLVSVWFTYLAELPAPVAVVLLLAAGLSRVLVGRLTAAWRIVVAAACATLLATFFVIMLKWGFGRLWPETWVENNPSWITNHRYGFFPFHGGAGYRSFPSGHMARITAPCAVLWRLVPQWRALWTLPPVLVMAGLLGADFHFFSDCLAGILLGLVCARLAGRTA